MFAKHDTCHHWKFVMNYNFHWAVKCSTNKTCLTCLEPSCTLFQQMLEIVKQIWIERQKNWPISHSLCSHVILMFNHNMHCNSIYDILYDDVCNMHNKDSNDFMITKELHILFFFCVHLLNYEAIEIVWIWVEFDLHNSFMERHISN